MASPIAVLLARQTDDCLLQQRIDGLAIEGQR